MEDLTRVDYYRELKSIRDSPVTFGCESLIVRAREIMEKYDGDENFVELYNECLKRRGEEDDTR